MMLKTDHFTPLSRAVASIDRDDYAARFAVYDREHKALLRRLATAASPVSAADVGGEERAFRDAIRRIEFGDELEGPTLVPRDEPVSEAPPEPQPDPIWPQPRPARRDTLDVVNLPGVERDEAEAETLPAVEPLTSPAGSRSVVRRVGERLALAVVVLALLGVGLWMLDGRRGGAADPAPARSAADQAPPAADRAADTQPPPPNWLTPQMFFAPSAVPSSPSPPPSPRPSSSPSAPPPRAEVPLPLPRPEI
jgi:hypothetical protein